LIGASDVRLGRSSCAAVALRQIAPWRTGPQHPKDAVRGGTRDRGLCCRARCLVRDAEAVSGV